MRVAYKVQCAKCSGSGIATTKQVTTNDISLLATIIDVNSPKPPDIGVKIKHSKCDECNGFGFIIVSKLSF